MSRKRPRTPRIYAVVAHDYYLDEKFDDLPASAEVLWVRGLAWIKGRNSDGWIGRGQLRHLCPGSRTLAKDAKSLVRAGLWHEADGGYVVNSWERWNCTAAEQEALSEARSSAARARWDAAEVVREGDASGMQVHSKRDASGMQVHSACYAKGKGKREKGKHPYRS